MKEHLNIVPTIAGSNRDEVKLWLATAEYFVELDYSFFGSILKIPKVKLKDKDSFEAFNLLSKFCMENKRCRYTFKFFNKCW